MKKCVVCIMFIALLFMTACGGSKYDDMSFDELFDLGTKYLQESNYSEAVLVFSAAIKIDEKSVDSYIGLADAYIGLDKTKKAIEVLEKGLELTDDFGIRMKLNELKVGSDDYGQEMVTDDFIRAEELTVGGRPFYELTIDDVKSILPNFEEVEPVTYDGHAYRVAIADNIHFEQWVDGEHLDYIHYDWWDLLKYGSDEDNIYHQPELRNITGGEHFDEVLSKLGFTVEGIAVIKEACKKIDSDEDILPLCRVTGIDKGDESDRTVEVYGCGPIISEDGRNYKVNIDFNDNIRISLFFKNNLMLEGMMFRVLYYS